MTKYFKIKVMFRDGDELTISENLLTYEQAHQEIKQYKDTADLTYFIEYVATYPVTL